jgi:hypothetical protein
MWCASDHNNGYRDGANVRIIPHVDQFDQLIGRVRDIIEFSRALLLAGDSEDFPRIEVPPIVANQSSRADMHLLRQFIL